MSSSVSEVPETALRCLLRINQRVPITSAVIKDTPLSKELGEAVRRLAHLVSATKAAHCAGAAVKLLPPGKSTHVFVRNL
jgi:hypothetical protein